MSRLQRSKLFTMHKIDDNELWSVFLISDEKGSFFAYIVGPDFVFRCLARAAAIVEVIVEFQSELSRQSCEIRDLLKCKSRLALDKVNDFRELKSCILIL